MRNNQFGVNDRVVVTHTIDLSPYTVLVPGEKGTVADQISDMGIEGVEVRWDLPHDGLKQWDNVSLLTMPELAYIEPVRAESRHRVLSVLAGGGVIASLGLTKVYGLAGVGLGAASIFGALSSFF